MTYTRDHENKVVMAFPGKQVVLRDDGELFFFYTDNRLILLGEKNIPEEKLHHIDMLNVELSDAIDIIVSDVAIEKRLKGESLYEF